MERTHYVRDCPAALPSLPSEASEGPVVLEMSQHGREMFEVTQLVHGLHQRAILRVGNVPARELRNPHKTNSGAVSFSFLFLSLR